MASDTPLPGSKADTLRDRSFVGLLLTQLLTATNDNIFRWLAIGVGKDFVEASAASGVLMAGTACFVLPYLFLAAPAGYLADRFSKSRVVVGCKVAEILIMLCGIAAIAAGSMTGLFVVVALMGGQSALFSPAKLGSIPELLRPRKISAANGLFGLTTVGSTVVGMAVGSWLSEEAGYRGQDNLGLPALVLVGVAVVGWLFSLLLRRLPAANPTRSIPWNAPVQTVRDIGVLASNPALLRVALGIVFFWSIGALAQLNIDQFAFEGGATRETTKTPLLVALVVGVGAGSVLAGVWSSGRVELGILPLGAFGIALSSMLLFTAQGAIVDVASAWTFTFFWTGALLFMMGLSAGLFSVPLESYMQHHSPPDLRGAVLAAANFLVFSGVLVSSILFYGMRIPFHVGKQEHVEAIQTMPIDEAARREVAKFRDGWDRGRTPRLEEYLAEVDAPHRGGALARMLWVEVKARQRNKETYTLAEYYDRFPDDRATVKSVVDQASSLPLLSARQIFLLCGLGTIPVFFYIVFLIPQASIRFLVWLASKTVYRIRVYGKENLPERGGALLVPNHVSWVDGILLLLTSSRPIRMVVYAGNFQSRWLKWLADMWGAIMISPNPKVIVKALQTARNAVANGELVCIFPEGGITRSGQLQSFKPGLMKILKGTDAPVVPVYLDELWGSIFSFERQKFFWKWPRKWPYPVSIHFGPPLEKPQDISEVRRAVEKLGALAVQSRADRAQLLTSAFIAHCKKRKRQPKVADSSGAQLTGGGLLTRSLVLRRLLKRHVLDEQERFVGVLLPPSLGAVVTNAALALDRRVGVNLNYTVSSEVMNACIQQSGIKHVLTSKKFLDKMSFDLQAELVILEDFRDKAGAADKLISATQAYLLPGKMLERQLKLNDVARNDLLTLIFTSGSTGQPKGVMLSYANVASNVEAINQVVHLSYKDAVIGILPFFHSFGYTVTLWAVLGLDVRGVYHFSPLDGKQIGKLCKRHQATVMLSTPTFLRNYLRRCSEDDFRSLDVVVTGAEKLPADLADAFEKKFGQRPVEGYGTTELAPLASVNVPPSRSTKDAGVDCKQGTVGRPVPGVAAKIVDLDTGQELGANQTGMLLIKGANVMQGYYGRDDLTQEVIQDGWYTTGDVALIDDDGFITITGRQSRFSKIGGEMVPHIQVEEALNQAIGIAEDDAQLTAAVTALPHPSKGEKLVVLHTPLQKSPEELIAKLKEMGLPNLFIPAKDCFFQVDSLPMLGSGKLDLKALKTMAEQQECRDSAS